MIMPVRAHLQPPEGLGEKAFKRGLVLCKAFMRCTNISHVCIAFKRGLALCKAFMITMFVYIYIYIYTYGGGSAAAPDSSRWQRDSRAQFGTDAFGILPVIMFPWRDAC